MSEENKVNGTEEQSEAVQADDKKQEPKLSKKERLDAELRGLSMKERKKVLEERKDKRRRTIYIIIGAVIALLVIALLFWDSGVLQRHLPALKVGNKSYSAAEVDYYYYNNYNTYANYGSYYGLDTAKSLKEQEIYEGTSWYDYFRDGAKSTLTNVSILNQEAEKEGYTLSDKGKKELDETLKTLKDNCKENGYSVSYYLKATYGKNMNYSIFKKMLTDAELAEEYQTKMTESFEQSDKDIKAYYKKHAAELDTFEYAAYMISAAPETEQDEEGNAKEPTEKQTKAAQKKAKKGADALQAALEEQDKDEIAKVVEEYGASDQSSQGYSSFSSTPFSDWLTDKDRELGDVKTFKDESEGEEKGADKTLNGYYVVRFEKRYLDEYHNANYRNLLVSAEVKEDAEDASEDDTDEAAATDYEAAEKTAKKLEKQWQKDGGDTDAFAKLAEKESADENNKEDGGLNESVSKEDVDDATAEWLFSDKRKEGDHTILKDEASTGYQLLCFQSFNERMHWQDASVEALQQEAYGDWYEGVEKNYKDSTTFMYRYV
jgi:hypothetical protein